MRRAPFPPGRRSLPRAILVMCLSLAGTRAWAGDPAALDCAPAVRLQGPAVAIGALAEALARVGLEAPEPGCPATAVEVQARGDTLLLNIVDAFGRATSRTVRTVGGAAAVIASRTRLELVEAPPEPPHTVEAIPPWPGPPSGLIPADDAEALTPVPVAPSATVSVVAAPGESRFSLAVLPETSFSSDGATWLGVAFSGGVAVGPLCIGPLVRFKSDLQADRDSEPVQAGGDPVFQIRRRRAADLALSIEVPWHLGGLELRPGVELGVGWMDHQQELLAIRSQVGNGPSQLKVPAPPPPDADLERRGARAGAQLAAAWRLGGRWHLQAAVGIGVSFFAHQEPYSANGLTAPEEPDASLRTSIGIRYGGR